VVDRQRPAEGDLPPHAFHGRIEEHAHNPSTSAIAEAPCGSGSGRTAAREQTAAQRRLRAISCSVKCSA
jgi:hypothetical protein